jgi:hypothetical protein
MPPATLVKPLPRTALEPASAGPRLARPGAQEGRPSGPLWLALYFPKLPLEALCRGAGLEGPERPVVVTADVSTRTLVVAVNDKATAAGVRAGMRLTAACALAPDLAVLRRDPAEESAALDGLAAWSGQFTSFTSVEQQGLLLEIGGSLKLFGGLEALYRRIKAGVRMLGYDALTGIGPTPSGAWLLARSGFDVPVVSPALLSSATAAVCPGTVSRAAQRRGWWRFWTGPSAGAPIRGSPTRRRWCSNAVSICPSRSATPARCWRPPGC